MKGGMGERVRGGGSGPAATLATTSGWHECPPRDRLPPAGGSRARERASQCSRSAPRRELTDGRPCAAACPPSRRRQRLTRPIGVPIPCTPRAYGTRVWFITTD